MEPADLTEPPVESRADAEVWADGPDDAAAHPGEAGYRVFLRVLGTDLRLDCVHAQSAEIVARAWSWCVVAEQDSAQWWVVDVGDVSGPLSEENLTFTNERICSVATGRLDPSWLPLTVFALADRARKVTLVAGRGARDIRPALVDLCRSEYAYVGSDLVALGSSGSVLACPKPIVMASGPRLGRRFASRGPQDIGLLRALDPLALGRMIILEPDGDPSAGPTINPGSLTDVVLAFAPQISPWPSQAEPLVRLARLLDHCGGAYIVRYSPGEPVTGTLRQTLSMPASGVGQWTPVTDRPANPMAWGLRDGRVRQKPVVDAIEAEGEVLVLVDRAPVHLGPLGATIWRRSIAGGDYRQLEGAAVAEHGPHPQAGDLVRAGVAELSSAGIVARGAPMTLASVVAGGLRR